MELKRLQKKLGITFVYVTHDQEEAMTMSDRIAVMRNGVIDQLGSPVEVYERPRTRFVADFIGESNVIDGKVLSVDGDTIVVETAGGTVTTIGEGFAAGDPICLSIRPEFLEISKTPVAGFDMPAHIKDFIYAGSVVRTSIDLAGGQEIKLTRFEMDNTFAEGEAIYVWWDPAKSVAIHVEKAAEEMAE